MSENDKTTAWNNFVMRSNPGLFEKGDERRAAAIANRYMGGVNGGGMNSFLTYSYDLDVGEVVNSLKALGANVAAGQLESVLNTLGNAMPAMSENERWLLLEESWTEALDELDMLSDEAESDLMTALERHVTEYQDYYLYSPARNN